MSTLFFGSMFVIIGAVAMFLKQSKDPNLQVAKKIVSVILPVLGVIILLGGMLFIADSDKSYVVQWPTGRLNTHFRPGIKAKMFGKVYPYDRVIAVATPSFVAEKRKMKKGKDLDAIEELSGTVNGILPPPLVRFTDAAKGNAYGIVRVSLPLEKKGLLNIHRELGSIEKLINNVLKNTFRSSAIASARLMSIQDYITKRGSDFDEYFSDQFSYGLYKTSVQERIISTVKPIEADVTKVDKENIDKDDSRVDEDGKTIGEFVDIVYDSEGKAVRQGINDISRYGLQVITAKITYLNPEDRVRKLIGNQRDAEARAALAENNRRASLLEAEAEEAEGQKQVAKARAIELAVKETLLIKEEAAKAATLINAQRLLEQSRLTKKDLIVKEEAKKEATIIQARKRLEEAELNKKTAKIKAEEAKFKKAELILIGEGEAQKKTAIMKADGALKQKLASYERVMAKFAEEFGRQKWVPEIQMSGGSQSGTGNEASDLIKILTTKALMDLGLDTRIPASSYDK